jgi:phenylpropionate dioxygenase-like ring-hydroxylating dioxygenase large terminal subunit
MYLKNQWYVAATSAELGNSLIQRWLLDEPYVMYRTQAGKAVVFDDRCPHRRFALSKGVLDGDTLTCGYHGLSFSPDGTCVRIPGQDKIPSQIRARSVPVVEKHTWVWIWPGDADKADESMIPDFHWMEKEGWTVNTGYRQIACNYQLLVDNLLDLTHETFVHAATIGHAELAEVPIEARRENGTVHVDRIVRECDPPPLFAQCVDFSGKVDRYQLIRFRAPSSVWIDARAVDTGSNDFDTGLRWEVLNAITPATPDRLHYFWGVSRAFGYGDESTTAKIQVAIEQTFDEDQVILEEQHKLIKLDGAENRMNAVHNDRGVVLARRLVEERMAAEAGA